MPNERARNDWTMLMRDWLYSHFYLLFSFFLFSVIEGIAFNLDCDHKVDAFFTLLKPQTWEMQIEFPPSTTTISYSLDAAQIRNILIDFLPTFTSLLSPYILIKLNPKRLQNLTAEKQLQESFPFSFSIKVFLLSTKKILLNENYGAAES